MKDTITGTSGDPVRVAFATIKRVLMDPVEFVHGGDEEYAMVHCEKPWCSLTRHGVGDRSCTYSLSDHDAATSVTYPAAKRDAAIDLFLKMVKGEKRGKPEQVNLFS